MAALPNSARHRRARPGLCTLRFPGWGELQGWSAAAAYSTILSADVDGGGQAEIMGALGGRLQTYHFHKTLGQWKRLADFQLGGYEIVGIEASDLDGDGQAELVIAISGWKYIVSTRHFTRTAMACAHEGPACETNPSPSAVTSTVSEPRRCFTFKVSFPRSGTQVVTTSILPAREDANPASLKR